MFESLSVKKLRDDLDYWIFIKIGNDIVEFKSQRPEYLPLVLEAQRLQVDDIPSWVLSKLNEDLNKPWFMRKTLWNLVLLKIKGLYNRIKHGF